MKLYTLLLADASSKLIHTPVFNSTLAVSRLKLQDRELLSLPHLSPSPEPTPLPLLELPSISRQPL